MKYQDLFSLENLKNRNKCCLLQSLLGALRVKTEFAISFLCNVFYAFKGSEALQFGGIDCSVE